MKNSHLALGGLFITLHLVFIFMSRIFVGSELLLVIFLPLLSTIYSLKFAKKETIMFFIATFILCVIFEPISTFIYVLPALICGTTYGILSKYKVKELSLVYISSLAHFLSLSLSFLFVSIMFKEVSFFEIFSNFINKDGDAFYASIYLILISIGVLEAFCVHIITSNELEKFGYQKAKEDLMVSKWINIGLVFSVVSYIILGIINPIFTCYVYPFLLAFVVPSVVEFVLENKRKWIYFVCGITLFIILFLLKYVSLIFYPSLLLCVALPIILEKIGRVLYTNSSKYLNNGKNNIK